MKSPEFSRFKRLFSSVFTKLLVISLVTWLCIVIATISVFVVSRHGYDGPFVRNVSVYAAYIIRDIGAPPDLAKAQKLAEDTGMHISFIGSNQRWSTRAAFPDIENLRFRNLRSDTSIQVRKRAGRHILRYQTGDGILFFEFTGGNEEDRKSTTFPLLLFGLLSLILLCSYLLIRRVLAPLKWFKTGVHKVKEGDLGYQVPLRGNDELTDIAGGFNEMTSQLKIMLENKENLLRDVSHELRTPLTRMKVALEFLEKSEAREDISQDIQAMEEMIQAILETARYRHKVSQPDFEELDVAEAVEAVTTRYQDNTPAVLFSSANERYVVSADRKLLQSVVSNCIDNGIKYSAKTSDPIVVSIKRAGERAVISIVDNGSGIEESELPYIFEPFYRIDSSRSAKTGGYGLGLAICKTIMETHGGTIKAESAQHKGTTIELTLPLL